MRRTDTDDRAMTYYLIICGVGMLSVGLPILHNLDRLKAR